MHRKGSHQNAQRRLRRNVSGLAPEQQRVPPPANQRVSGRQTIPVDYSAMHVSHPHPPPGDGDMSVEEETDRFVAWCEEGERRLLRLPLDKQQEADRFSEWCRNNPRHNHMRVSMISPNSHPAQCSKQTSCAHAKKYVTSRLSHWAPEPEFRWHEDQLQEIPHRT
jgi:hypothetical protein